MLTRYAPSNNLCLMPSGNRILVTGSLPYFYVYSNQQEVKQEYDTFEINRREKEMGSPLSLSTNSLVI